MYVVNNAGQEMMAW